MILSSKNNLETDTRLFDVNLTTPKTWSKNQVCLPMPISTFQENLK